MKTSKSPNKVAKVAYETARQSLPAYTHRYSPKKFTQHQLAACLVLKEFFNTDYRGIVEIIADSQELQKILELEQIPHFTTLQKAAKNILRKKSLIKLLKETIKQAQKSGVLDNNNSLAAMDSTGLESGHTSRYFVKRRERGAKNLYQTTTYKRFPKLALACDTLTHLIIGTLPLRGPSADVIHFKQLLVETINIFTPKTMLADAGYDAEESHRFAREDYNIKTIIPPRAGRPTKKLPTGYYRRKMATNFDKETYGQRWQSETVMSMLKRNLDEELHSKNYWSQCREMMLKVITHNVMIVYK